MKTWENPININTRINEAINLWKHEKTQLIFTRNASLKHASKNAKKKLHIHQIFLILFWFKKWMYNLYFIFFLSINKSYFIKSAKSEYKVKQNTNFLCPYFTKQRFHFDFYCILWKMIIKCIMLHSSWLLCII